LVETDGGEKMNGIISVLRGRLRYVCLGILLLLAGCTGQEPEDNGGPTTTPGTPGATASPTEPAASELAESTLTAELSGSYKIRPDGTRVPPTERELPVRLGTVEANWYRSGGVYVIAFGGLDLEESGPVCPGSSIQTDSGFEHVTSSPTGEGACEGAPNLAGPDAGVRTCGPLVLYITEIPEDTEGDLFASVERYEGERIVGVTGVVEADMSAAPEMDAEATEYSLPEGLVEGTTEVTC
jgi:hypothetical protein